MNKKIERIVLISVLSVGALVLGVVPLISYAKYESTQKAANDNSQATPIEKKTLSSISAKLKDGVSYFNNGKAKVSSDDIEIMGIYSKGSEEIEELIDTSNCSVTTPIDFAINGGDITIAYKGKEDKITVNLTEVVPTSIEVKETPYKTVYQVGDYFLNTGLSFNVTYNDGATKTIDSGYMIATSRQLRKDDKSVSIIYDEGSTRLNTEVAISVVDNLNDQAFESLLVRDGSTIENGAKYSEASFTLLGKYPSGNLKAIDGYSIANSDEVAKLGIKPEVEVSYNGLSCSFNPKVISKIEAESATLFGNYGINTEDEYTFSDGTFTKGDSTTFVGSFGTGYGLEVDVTDWSDAPLSLSLKLGNGNLSKDTSSNYWMSPLQLNTVMHIYADDEEITLDDGLVLKAIGPSLDFAYLYDVFEVVEIDNITLPVGTSTLKIELGESSIGELNYWEEPPSVNIDYLSIATSGKSFNSKEITSISSNDQTMIVGEDKHDVLNKIEVIGTSASGEYLIPNSECTFSVESGVATSDYTVEIVYKSLACRLKVNVIPYEEKIEADSYQIIGNGEVKSDANGSYIENTKANTSLIGKVSSSVERDADLYLRIANGYHLDDKKVECQLNKTLAISLNSSNVTISDSVVLSGNDTGSWTDFQEVKVSSIHLLKGENAIKISYIDGGLRNAWNESPTHNISWMLLRSETK